jgi:hypothetical protein
VPDLVRQRKPLPAEHGLAADEDEGEVLEAQRQALDPFRQGLDGDIDPQAILDERNEIRKGLGTEPQEVAGSAS